jgi:hypothetical protein
MPAPGTARARWALVPLWLSDGLLLLRVAPAGEAFQLSLGLSTLAWVMAAIDLVLGAGLVLGAHWARELSRYRCWLASAFLGFAWLVYLMAQPSTSGTGVSLAELLAMIRDGLVIGFYALAWALLREPRARPPAPPGAAASEGPAPTSAP